MEREKGEYLDMDENKHQELDQQAREYVSDAPEAPSMNAEPEAHADTGPDSGPDAPDAAERVES